VEHVAERPDRFGVHRRHLVCTGVENGRNQSEVLSLFRLKLREFVEENKPKLKVKGRES
jgi:hypothetical protein